jgi:hypothetical protein
MLPYFKLFTEAGDDPKLRSLSDAQFRVWFRLLCCVARQPKRGTVRGLPERLVAVEVADGDLDLLVATLDALQALRMVAWRREDPDRDDLEIVFLNFEKRQAMNTPKKPSEERARVRERVARSRGRKRSDDVTPVTPPVTPHVTPCNAPVTPCNTFVTPCNEFVTPLLDRDLDGDSEESIPPCVPPPPDRGPTHPRPGDDLSLVNRAISLLGTDGDTEAVALQLGRQHNTTGLSTIAGWKWLRAAEKLLDPAVPAEKRRSFPYLAAIAKNLTEAEREAKAPPRRESAAERKAREMDESMKRRMIKEAARNGDR